MEFCKKLSVKTGKTATLPTEAQWEYACRAGSETRFGFGDDEADLGDYAWYDKNSDLTTHPVGQKKPNEWGLYDMHGNVWQWCQDWYGDYTAASKTDPTGPDHGLLRVMRGGAWYGNHRRCWSSYRNKHDPVRRVDANGFRVVVAAGGPT